MKAKLLIKRRKYLVFVLIHLRASTSDEQYRKHIKFLTNVVN